MYKRISFLIVFLFLQGCSITNYTTIPVLGDREGVIVTRIVSTSLAGYDTTIAISWQRTFNRCVQVKSAIDKEIDQRESKEINWRATLVGIGGLTGIAVAVYSAAKTNPSKSVLSTLGVLSATSLTSYFAFLTDDERAKALKVKSENLDRLRREAEQNLNILEKMITEKGILLNIEKKPENSKVVITKTKEIEEQIITFRQALSDWDTETR